MLGQIIEVVEPNRYLSVKYGSMIIKSGETVLGSLDLDNIQSVVVNPHGVTVSASLLAELAERGIPFVISGKKFLPVATLLPLSDHFESSSRIEAQAKASEPQKKQAWKSVVRSKILMQALALKALDRQHEDILEMTSTVKSGDPENTEAQAARRYWPRIFGESFRRNRDLEGENALLNYGYTVLRSTTAKAIAASGLHPGLGIHHRSAVNTMRLADDFMEPFRPFVDLRVHAIVDAFGAEVNVETKRALVTLFRMDVPTEAGTSPLSIAIARVASSYVKYLRKERESLELPGTTMEVHLLKVLEYEL